MVQTALVVLILSVYAGFAEANPCAGHIQAITKIRGIQSKDPVCLGQVDHVASTLEKGLELCQRRNGMEIRPLPCTPSRDRNSSLRDVGAAGVAQAGQSADASALNTQYHGIADALIEKESNCVNRLRNLRKQLACSLPLELGQKAREESYWNQFWNREKSKAPFAESISPEVRLLGTTAASAYLWRGVRGGGTLPNPNDSYSTQRRAITALGYTGLGYANGGTDGAIAGALMTPGLFIPYGKYMQKQHGKNRIRDFAYMTGAGLATTALPALYLSMRGYNPWPLLAGGAAKGLCYYGAYQWGKGAFANSPDKGFVGGVETQTAELCHGATIGAGLSGSLLYSNNEPEDKKRSTSLCADSSK